MFALVFAVRIIPGERTSPLKSNARLPNLFRFRNILNALTKAVSAHSLQPTPKCEPHGEATGSPRFTDHAKPLF